MATDDSADTTMRKAGRGPRRALRALIAGLGIAIAFFAYSTLRGEVQQTARPDTSASSAGSGRIDADAGGEASSEFGISVEVPPGALDADGVFHVEDVEGVAPRFGRPVIPPMEVTLGDNLFDVPVTLSFDVAEADRPGDVVIAKLDEETGLWVDLPTSYDAKTQTVSAQVSSFSVFTAIGGFVGRSARAIKRAAGSVLGAVARTILRDLRSSVLSWSAPAPKCKSGRSKVVVTMSGGSPFKLCTEPGSDGDTRVRLANNRTYAITFPGYVEGTLDRYGVSVDPGMSRTLVGAALAEFHANVGGEGFVQGRGETTLTVDREAALPFDFGIRPTWHDLAAEILIEVTLKSITATASSRQGKHWKKFPAKGCGRGDEPYLGRQPAGWALCLRALDAGLDCIYDAWQQKVRPSAATIARVILRCNIEAMKRVFNRRPPRFVESISNAWGNALDKIEWVKEIGDFIVRGPGDVDVRIQFQARGGPPANAPPPAASDYATACMEGWFKDDCTRVDMASIEDAMADWVKDEARVAVAVRCPRQREHLSVRFHCDVYDLHGSFRIWAWWTSFNGDVEWGVCTQGKKTHPELRRISPWARYWCD